MRVGYKKGIGSELASEQKQQKMKIGISFVT
jgi:hypothetical protein